MERERMREVDGLRAARVAARSLLRERRGRRGMSLIEVMVVIAIILTVTGVLSYGIMSAFQDSQVQTTILSMSKVNDRVQIYMLRKKEAPSALGEAYGNEEPPTDSWGNAFELVVPGPNGMDFDIVSYGADGQEGGSGSNADIKWSEAKDG